MYEAFFGLQRRPFATVPQVEQYFAAAATENARQNLIRCIERGEGPAVVVGPSGAGKTLVCQLLAAHFRGVMRVAHLVRGRLSSRRALLQAILYELQQPYRGMDEGELRLALVDYVVNNETCPNGLLLLVDEAHLLPLRLLDELRMLTNVAADGQPRVRLTLAGNAEIEERLASPRLDSFTQRIVVRCYLEALNRGETEAYIRTRFQRAGGDADGVFPGDACLAVHRATDGVPRLVNQVCDHALLLACAAGIRRASAALVEEAWGDLQQLPTPWNGEQQPAKAASEAVIEFGGLDDDDAEETAPPAAVGPPTLPMLRVSPQDDDAAPPAESLEQIGDALSQLDDDFQPAGTIGPEVELVLQDPNDPFSETFEQEEWVTKRHTAEPPAQEAPLPATTPSVEAAPDSVDALAAVGAEIAELRDTLLPAAAAAETAPASPAEQRLEEQTLPLRADAPVDDSDLIIVEDDYEGGPPPPPRPVAPVRQSEYRRLFASLRQG